jgi:hypothetical protein
MVNPVNETLIQTAFVVRDIHESITTYVSKLKVGPWFLIERFTPAEAMYRGEPTDLVMSVAFAFRDAMMLELIQQHDDSPSVFRDVVTARGYGLHHLGITTDTYDVLFNSYLSAGFECAFTARTTGRLAMFEMSGLPHLVEILELDPKRRKFFSAMAEAATNWDGSFPIRPYGE